MSIRTLVLMIVVISGCVPQAWHREGIEKCAIELVSEHAGIKSENLYIGLEILCATHGRVCYVVHEKNRLRSWEVSMESNGCFGDVMMDLE